MVALSVLRIGKTNRCRKSTSVAVSSTCSHSSWTVGHINILQRCLPVHCTGRRFVRAVVAGFCSDTVSLECTSDIHRQSVVLSRPSWLSNIVCVVSAAFQMIQGIFSKVVMQCPEYVIHCFHSMYKKFSCQPYVGLR